MKAKEEPPIFSDGDEWDIIDLRPFGIDCLPVLARGSFKAVREGAALHVHRRHIEVSLCIKGNIRYETEEGELQLLPGRFFLSKPGEVHRRCNNPKGMLLYRFLFKLPERGGAILELSREESGYIVKSLERFPFTMCPSSQRINLAFERLFSTYDNTRLGEKEKRLELKSAALDLLLAVIEAPNLPPTDKGRPNKKIEAIVAEMNEHPERSYPLEEISSAAALSTVSFSDAFKRITGLPPHAYLIDVRIRRAREDLAKGGVRIADIAKKYCFPSSQHFSTVFKRITGTSPRMVRGPFRKGGTKEFVKK